MANSERLTRRAPAKINLGLHVLRKRDDGYHDIETVFHRIGWSDVVSVEPADRLSMTCSDPDLPTDEANLCMQAALDLQDAAGVMAGAQIHLEKRVPYGAGLGGGSSDAAITLLLLADLWLSADDAGELPRAEVHAMLRDVAAGVGSDVPFFLEDLPAAYATGRGEILEPLRAEVGGFELDAPLVVVVPPVEVSTPDAYGRVTPRENERPDLRSLVASADVTRWRRELVNDFSATVLDAYPEVASAHDMLVEMGASYVSLSGSGSAVYGVFDDSTNADAAEVQARARGYEVGRGV
ncbi:4-(cytidine 5'-diphospho)-2-C-methyl-D-erythritol kinase [Longibacter salinarum]|uniref:4-diphosphocytidyl-2-C-methyl-D-erythritol kinase n=1 Tax=Longibacter salinarum TaxID=1850348 RepID=A0A2A8D0F1_9BACT|nr:4-(cytidine 5'-diphospho)-2-C-methyl-D-erythritol kinase [Longibacter salinarum]PEN14341.1 4-(cytidine 5'-diphospho)-2-C-methyl-D-erythritol kinase [Longibacter salinarum]